MDIFFNFNLLLCLYLFIKKNVTAAVQTVSYLRLCDLLWLDNLSYSFYTFF